MFTEEYYIFILRQKKKKKKKKKIMTKALYLAPRLYTNGFCKSHMMVLNLTILWADLTDGKLIIFDFTFPRK